MMNGANHGVLYRAELKHQTNKEGVAGSLTLLPQSLP